LTNLSSLEKLPYDALNRKLQQMPPLKHIEKKAGPFRTTKQHPDDNSNFCSTASIYHRNLLSND